MWFVFIWLGLLRVLTMVGSQTTLSGLVDSLSFQIRTPSDAGIWRIVPSISLTTVHFCFERMNINSAELQIYDLEDYQRGRPAVFNCVACGVDVPPMFATKTGNVIIFIKGVVGVNFIRSDFTLKYIGEPSSAIGGVGTAFTNLDLTFNMAYGKIFPFQVQGSIPSSARTSWLINLNAPVLFSFDRFKSTADSSCRSILTLYDGQSRSSPVLFNGTVGASFPSTWLRSSGGKVFAVLQNGPTTDNCDFEISYYSDADLYRCGSLFQPDVLQSLSMVLVDGSPSAGQMRRGVSCNWRITSGQSVPIYDRYYTTAVGPTAAPTSFADVYDLDSKLTLIFPWVSLKSGGRVVVYDNAIASGSVLWDSLGTNTVIPPPLLSTGRSLFIAYTSNSYLSDGYRGFRGEYWTRTMGSVGIGSQTEVLSMSSALDISPPGHICLGSGSSAADCVYTTGVNYSWAISPLRASGSGAVTFMFSALMLTHPGDSLTIYDGIDSSSPVLSRWTGKDSPLQFPYRWLQSSGPVAFVRFISSGDTVSRTRTGGFKFSYYSDGPNYHCGFSTNPAALRAPNQVFTDGSAASENMLGSQQCEWRLEPAFSDGGITLLFHRMDMPRGAELSVYQEVIADDGVTPIRELIVTVTSTRAIPAPIALINRMYITYSTSSTPEGTGFMASYFSDQGINSQTGTRTISLESTSMMKLELPPSTQTSLYAPGWSGTWVINPATVSGPIFISVNRAVFPVDCSDFLEIYENVSAIYSRRIWTSCGARPRRGAEAVAPNLPSALDLSSGWISSLQSTLTMRFVSAGSSAGISSFDLSYNTDGPNFHCGFAKNPAVINAASFVLSDGSARGETLYADQDCQWIIHPTLSNSSVLSTSTGVPIDSNNDFEKLVVFLKLHACDLRGARMQIYDGTSADGILLWDCDNCQIEPPQMVSSTGTFFVKYLSYSSATRTSAGTGFKLYYWSAAIPIEEWKRGVHTNLTVGCSRSSTRSLSAASACASSAQVVLEQPAEFSFDETLPVVKQLSSSGKSWVLNYPEPVLIKSSYMLKNKLIPAVYSRPVSVLSFWPSTTFQYSSSMPFARNGADDFSRLIQSGRVGNEMTLNSELFTGNGRSLDSQKSYCGIWHTETPEIDLERIIGYYDSHLHSLAQINNSIYPRGPILQAPESGFSYRPSQSGGDAGIYVAPPNSWRAGQENISIRPDKLFRMIKHPGASVAFAADDRTADSDVPYPSSLCKYAIDTSPPEPPQLNNLNSGGLPVTFNIRTVSCGPMSAKRLRIFGGLYGNDTLIYDSSSLSFRGVRSVVAPCGRAIILLDTNSNSSTVEDACGFELEYEVDYSDVLSRTCSKYIKSIFYVPPKEVDYMIYIIPVVSVVGALMCLCCGVLYLPSLILFLQEKYKNYNRIGAHGHRRYVKTTSLHPRYTPKMDSWRNKFLRRDICCVCKDGPFPVFRLTCNHRLCNDDLKGYIESALGDISMFPLKCPMHYEGCTGLVGSDVAKRVINQAQYCRFIDFVDRALFGDGIRCIFCENFVIYPSDSKVSMVQCPYCVQHFCMRCRQPWHYGATKCPLEKAEDESLETWKKVSGAQRCPACRKLIEKDDPDTCHHMVHRVSDGIPCVRERTDFCYLCGLEVAAEYPHVEVGLNSAGVNHFPDGVFQRCRTIINKEKAEERERLRKSKRMKKTPKKNGSYSSSFVLPNEWDTETASTPSLAGVSHDTELVGIGQGFSVANAVLNDESSVEEGRTRFEGDFDEPWEQAVRTHPASPVRTTRRPPRR